MSHLETIVARSKAIESGLASRFGATGRGLHEKLDSVQGKLDPATVRAGRFIATIRNKTLHEDGFSPSEADMQSFVARCDEVDRAVGLGRGLKPRTNPLHTPLLALGAAVLLFVAILIIVVRPFRNWLNPPPPVRSLVDDMKVSAIVTLGVIVATIVLAVVLRKSIRRS